MTLSGHEFVAGPPPGVAPEVDEFIRRRYRRSGLERLPAHLEERYGVRVVSTRPLDLGVLRLDLADGRSWVGRLFPAERPIDQVRGDAEILERLAATDFPAERCAVPDPVSELEGQGLLVTEFVAGVAPERRRETIRALGGNIRLAALLARLHTMPAQGPLARSGGGWHHLGDGSPGDEIAAARSLLAAARPLVPAGQEEEYEALCREVEGLDGGAGLPQAPTHPDPALVNAVPTEERLVLVDWTGAGRAPRICSLAFLLFAAAAGDRKRVASVVRGYTRHVQPEEEELERLPSVIRSRPVILAVWGFCVGRSDPATTLREVISLRRITDSIAGLAVEMFRQGG